MIYAKLHSLEDAVKAHLKRNGCYVCGRYCDNYLKHQGAHSSLPPVVRQKRAGDICDNRDREIDDVVPVICHAEDSDEEAGGGSRVIFPFSAHKPRVQDGQKNEHKHEVNHVSVKVSDDERITRKLVYCRVRRFFRIMSDESCRVRKPVRVFFSSNL